MIPRPTVVILDVNETLSDMSGLGPSFERAGLSREAQATWFSNTLRDGIALTAAGGYSDFASVARSALMSLLAAELGTDADHSTGADLIIGAIGELGVHADVAPALERLHDGGIRTVALTNGSAATASSLLERAGLGSLVEDVMSADDVGRWKPAPEPYHYAVARCSVEPAQAMLVAVHPWDIDGAKRAGLRAAWVNRADLPYPRTTPSPDLIADDLASLAVTLTDLSVRSAGRPSVPA